MGEANEPASFERVAMPHMDAAYNLARWLAGNGADAEDIAQEAMLRALRFFDSFRGGDARAWILRIVRNTYCSHRRRPWAREPQLEFDEEVHGAERGDAMDRADDPESIVARAQELSLLELALESLPPEFREPLVLRELEHLSYNRIAAVLGIPVGTVMSRISRARRLTATSFARLRESRGIKGPGRGSFRRETSQTIHPPNEKELP